MTWQYDFPIELFRDISVGHFHIRGVKRNFQTPSKGAGNGLGRFFLNLSKKKGWPSEEKTTPKNSNNKPWAYICSKGFFGGLIFGNSGNTRNTSAV